MVVEIPLRSTLDYYSLDVDLDGRTFTFDVRWNDRAGAYFLRLSDAEGNVIVAGKRVITFMPLLSRLRGEDVPDGELECVDQSGQFQDAGQGELGDRVAMLYYPIADIPAEWKH